MDSYREKWYFKTYVLIFGVLVVGPLALPLLWINPKYKKSTKVIWTLIILVISFALTWVMSESLKNIQQYYSLAFGPQQ